MNTSNVIVKKLNKVAKPNHGNNPFDVVAFQLVEITIKSLNHKATYDTRIYKNGRQEIINGDGFYPSGSTLPNC